MTIGLSERVFVSALPQREEGLDGGGAVDSHRDFLVVVAVVVLVGSVFVI